MRIEETVYLDFDDVLIKPKRSSLFSRKDVMLSREFTFKYSGLVWNGVPIMASNMDTVGTFEMYEALYPYGMPTMMNKFADIDEIIQRIVTHNNNFIIPSFGIRDEFIERSNSFLVEYEHNHAGIACFDVANGYTERFVDFIKGMRELFPSLTIIAGNVATPEAVEALVFAGADVVKCGIGPSKVCDTRIKTGIGVPQLTATIECADAAHGLGAHIIADGGCKTPADVAKAFAAGADFVMLGSMLAAHKESGGEEKIEDIDPFAGITKKYKEVYGMSSEHAMKKHYGEKAEYRASEGNHQWVEYRGPVKNTIEDVLGGLRSTMTYVGARRLKDLSKCATFIRVNRIK